LDQAIRQRHWYAGWHGLLQELGSSANPRNPDLLKILPVQYSGLSQRANCRHQRVQ
jgi:hypothetical protein